MVKPRLVGKYVQRYVEVLNNQYTKASEDLRPLLPDHFLPKQEIRVYLVRKTGVAIDYLGMSSKLRIDFQISDRSLDDLIFLPTDPPVPAEIGVFHLQPVKVSPPDQPIRTVKLMGSMEGIVLFKIDNAHVFAYSQKIMNENYGRYAFFNIYVQRQYPDGTTRSKYVRYAELYPDKEMIFTPARAENNAVKDFQDHLDFLKAPNMAPSIQKYVRIGEAVHQLKKNSVAVLGRDSPPESDLLRRIRDELRALNYHAFLVREEESLAEQTPEEKVKLLTLMSRFCVMEDSTASGHIAEFEYCKTNRVLLILLRRAGHGSTWMIGDAGLVDFNFIRTFEFSEANLHEVLVEATRWAEDFLSRRALAYKDYFP